MKVIVTQELIDLIPELSIQFSVGDEVVIVGVPGNEVNGDPGGTPPGEGGPGGTKPPKP